MKEDNQNHQEHNQHQQGRYPAHGEYDSRPSPDNTQNQSGGQFSQQYDSEPGRQGQKQEASKHQLWKYAVTVLVTVLITFSLTAGSGLMVLMFMQPDRLPTVADPDDQLGFHFADNAENREAIGKLYEVYEAIQNNYYEDLSDAQLIDAMAKGLVNEMESPYTMYLTAEQVERIDESMSGQYSGIGAYVTLNPDGYVMITDIIEESPAEEIGLMVGDLFMEVDGEDVSDFGDVNAVAALVRGIEGTTVDLVVYRPGIQEYVELTATRRVITTESVVYRMLTPAIGYIHIREFSQNSGQYFVQAMEELQSQGAVELVFDLRNNTGGLANEVILMLDYLLPEAVIATLQGRRNGEAFSESWMSEKQVGVSEDMHYAILINEISASASELFAGCLRDYEKASLIGKQTMGKGSGTITVRLEDGSAINLTNFLYYLPNGESIEGVGIAPDIVVSLPDDASGLPVNRIPQELDDQLQAAVDYLNNRESR